MSIDANPPAPQPRAGIHPFVIVAIVVMGLVLTMCLLGIVTALLLPAVQAAREAARRNACQNHFKQIQLALLNYESAYRTLPPAYFADADGKPMHSWRVLILPFMDREDLYKAYDFNEPWNGPNNSKLADKIGGIYSCPSDDHVGHDTSYVAVVGPETAWPGDRGIKLRDIKDGLASTITTVEVADSGIHWMEPRDLTFDQAAQGVNFHGPQRGISSHHPHGAIAGYADGHVMMLPDDIPSEVVRSLLTIAGGDHKQWQE